MIGRKPKKVYCISAKSANVVEFDSLQRCADHYGTTYGYLRKFIDNSILFNGFYISYSRKFKPKIKKEKILKKVAPWEKNGYFNIDGWLSSCIDR